MNEIISKRGWDSKIFDTGRVDEKVRPIYGTKLQNGIHDEESDGSFVEVNTKFQSHEVGVSTDRVIRNRCGEVRISDTGSESKDLAKIKTKRNCGISVKLKGIKTYGPFFDDLKSCYYNTDDGVKLRYYPHYTGMSIVIEIANPQTASNVYRFSLKEYGCDYTYEEIDGAIKCVSSTGEDNIWIKATYAIDGNGDGGSVYMRLGSVVDGYQEIEKVISPVWLGNATAPVLSDPDVTIEAVDGLVDSFMYNTLPNTNYGSSTVVTMQEFNPPNEQRGLLYVPLSSVGEVNWLNGKFTLGPVSSGGALPYDVKVYRLKRTWTEGTVTWNNADTAWGTPGADNTTTDRDATEESTVSVDNVVTDFPISADTLNNHWNNDADNKGIVIIRQTTGGYVHFKSNQNLDIPRPLFYGEYTEEVAGGQTFTGMFGLGRLGLR